MTPERWQLVTQVHEAALERDPSSRQAFLAVACAEDEELRREVDSLLAHEATPVLVDSPVLEVMGGLLDVDARLPVGAHVGHYRIDAFVGAGGMGEVYRARDTRLQRDVALKVLPDALADDPDFLDRFRREAQVLASLNHPAIAAIYGFEDLGRVRALVLELVEGPTLADRLHRGSIPLDEALPIAAQIAEALEAAHQRGIIHRDLKPANVKVTEEGTVKLLDFGLAKPIVSPAVIPDAEPDGDAASLPPSIQPSMTDAGAVLGTAAYMSPEQVKGRALDKRSDLWSFGCVFFEMLTAKPAFSGADGAATLHAVVTGEPDWAALPPDMPDAIKALLRRCLIRERRQRIADAGIVRYVLADAAQAPQMSVDERPHRRAGRSPVILTSVIAATLTALLLGAVWMVFRSAPLPLVVTRSSLLTAGAETLTLHGMNRDVAIAPDGRTVVYRAGSATQWHLTARSLDELEARPLPNTSGGNAPFFKPDGAWVGFSGGAQLQKTPLTGGVATVLCPIAGASLRGASWGPDGTIYFADSDPSVGLLGVPEAGGTPQPLTKPDAGRRERDHWFPHVLPNGRGVLFTVAGEQPGSAQVAVLDRRTGVHRILLPGSDARYVDSGHLVYVLAGALRAVLFDPVTLEISGDPVPLQDQVLTLASGVGNFAISRNGHLLHVLGGTGPKAWPARTLVWVDRQGREEPIAAEPRAYASPRLSPDGTRLALEIRDGEPAIWIWDLRRGILERANSDAFMERNPVWTPDGRLLFASDRGGIPNVHRQSIDGSGRIETLTSSSSGLYPGSISPDGARLFLTQLSPFADVMLLGEPSRPPELLIAQANSPEVSPDGRWLAYQTNRAVSTTVPGQSEVFVQRLPEVEGRRQRISNVGGSRPAWSPDGRELFYFDQQNRLTAVAVRDGGPELTVGTPTTLLPPAYFVDAGPAPGRPYEVTASHRFIMIKDDPERNTTSGTSIVLVQNWIEELKRLVPHR